MGSGSHLGVILTLVDLSQGLETVLVTTGEGVVVGHSWHLVARGQPPATASYLAPKCLQCGSWTQLSRDAALEREQ